MFFGFGRLTHYARLRSSFISNQKPCNCVQLDALQTHSNFVSLSAFINSHDGQQYAISTK